MNLKQSGHWTQIQKERQKRLRQIKKQTTVKQSYKSLFIVVLTVVAALPLAAFSIYSYKNYHSGWSLVISGNTIIVKKGANFQAALNRAKPGDTILLEAGATFEGAFKLPVKTGNEFITIRTSATDDQLPPADKRIDPKKYADVLPKLKSNVKGKPTIFAENGAHHFRFVGVEFPSTIEGLYNIIELGTTEEKTIEELPHHIEFDRVYIHGSPTEGQRRGIAANGRFIKIANSYISDIKRKGEESQAIAVWGSDGPVEITNNYLEAAAINILFGGAGSFLRLVPTGVVRGNHLNKPLNWREEGWLVKNLFEIKNGKNIKVENNLMTNNWGMGQDGAAILFTTRDEGNGDATVIEDIEFVNNIVRGSANGISIYGGDGRGGYNLTIRNNLFEDINGEKWGSAGYFMKSSDWNGLSIENNTIIQSGSIASAYGKPVKNFVFRNNIVFENEYGIKGDNMGSGQEVINKLFSNGTVTANIIIGGKSSLYSEKNFFLSSIGHVGFVNAERGDYRLQGGNPYLNKGFGRKRIGADLDASLVGGK